MIFRLTPLVFALTVLPALAVAVALSLLVLDSWTPPARYAAVLAIAYLLGSVPWGYMLILWRQGVDVREQGSGRTGMTNVLRTAGVRVAAIVLLLDMGKGLLSVYVAREVIGSTHGEVAAGLLALAGHNWPVFLQFRGGRGILTGFGGLWIMTWPAAAIAAAVMVLITLISRYVSLGNIIGVVIAFLVTAAMGWMGMYSPLYAGYTLIGGAIIIWQHRDNIQRILAGNERRLGNPAAKTN